MPNKTRSAPFQLVVEAVRSRVHEVLTQEQMDEPGEAEAGALIPLIHAEIEEYRDGATRRGYAPLDGELARLTRRILDEILGLGPLESLLAHDSVEDIYIQGPHKVMVVTSDGGRQAVPIDFGTRDRVMSLARRALARDGKRADFVQPFADCRLRDGSRMHVSIHPCAEPSPQIVIRKHRPLFDPGEDRLGRLIELGTVTPRAAALLCAAIRSRISILVAGATAAGKTTLINALAGEIDPELAVVCIEDIRELDFPGINVSYLMTRHASLEGKGAVTQRYLVQQALRKRGDWIVLGEARGEEAWDFAQAGNTGHAILGSVHANSAADAIERYRDLCLQAAPNLRGSVAMRVVSRAFRLVVFLEHDAVLGRRVVRQISEVESALDDQDTPRVRVLFDWEDSQLRCTGEEPSPTVESLLERGGILYPSILDGSAVTQIWEVAEEEASEDSDLADSEPADSDPEDSDPEDSDPEDTDPEEPSE